MSSWGDADDNYSDHYKYGSDFGELNTHHGGSSIYVCESPCPLEFLPFRDLVEAGIGYMVTQAEQPLYDSTMIEFLALAAGTISCMAYEREINFHRFLKLPAELRLEIYARYLEAARNDLTLVKHLHRDNYNKPCCIWRWPEELIICDRKSGKELPTAKYAPWLPDLAFTNKQVLGEVTICMLQTTEWYDFKYEESKPFKIVRWFTDFLFTFPTILDKNGHETTQGFAAIKRINFPHEHHYNERRIGKIIDEQNPDVQLMLKCTELDTIAMGFNWRQLTIRTPGAGHLIVISPRNLEEFLDFYRFRPMLEHKGVKSVHLEGVHPPDDPGATLDCLVEFGRWLIKGFREKQRREVDVYVNKRWKIFEKRSVGEKLVVSGEAQGMK
jgi:hypothetical protein